MKKLIFLLAFLATPLFAVEPDEIMDDPIMEARARVISKELRCVVCRNENIDESGSGIARDMRILVRERLVEGDTNEDVLQYMVDRYGDFVLLRPRFAGSNLLLWFSGPILIIFGGGAVFVWVRRRGLIPVDPGLSADEQNRLKELLGE